jgi:hypothetical protein
MKSTGPPFIPLPDLETWRHRIRSEPEATAMNWFVLAKLEFASGDARWGTLLREAESILLERGFDIGS